MTVLTTPTSRWTRRTRRATLAPLAALSLVLAFVLGALVPVPAHADDLDDTAQSYYEEFRRLIDGDPENEIDPLSVPEFVYRGDFRTWEEIKQAGGFDPLGDNGNIADHVLDLIKPKDTGYVATSSDPDLPDWFMKWTNRPDGADTFTVYKIRPSDQYKSVVQSFYDSIYPDGTVENYNRALLQRLESAKRGWFGHVQGEYEWASRGRIPASTVVESRTTSWVSGEEIGEEVGEWSEDPGEWEANPGFTEPTTRPTLDSVKFDAVTCPAAPTARASCATVPGNEDDLAHLNGDRFTGDPDDVDFTLRPDELAADESALLAPAPDTVDVVADFAGDVRDPSSFADFTEEIGGSFATDVDALADVTAHADVLTSLGKAMGFGIDTASELIPYLGIVATGYAMKEDIDHGAWGDLAADAIAEGIQGMMLAAPELDWILAPALWADLVLKSIGDWLYGLAHPAPSYTAEFRDNLAKAHDQVDAAPTTLTEAWGKERNAVLTRFYGEHMEERLASTLAAKIRSDVTVIKELERTVLGEIDRHRFLVLQRATTDAQRMAVQRSAFDAENLLHDTTREAIADRVQQYRDRYPDLVDATAAETWKLDLSELARDGFLADEKVSQYTVKVSEIAWEASYGKHWDRFESWELATARPRRDAEAKALRDIVVESERAGIKHEALADKDSLVRALGKQVDDAVASSVVVPANERATTTGVHALRLSADGALLPGKAATLSWNRAADAGASVTVPARGSVRWTLDLPSGLSAGKLPPRQDDGSLVTEWSSTDRRVTLTMTAKSAAVPVIGREQYAVPVTVTAGLVTGDLVEARFAAAAGTRSLAPSASTTVRRGGFFEAVNGEVVDIDQGSMTVRFTAAMADSVGYFDSIKLRTESPEGIRFPLSQTLRASFRTSANEDWSPSGPDLRATSTGYRKLVGTAERVLIIQESAGQLSWESTITVQEEVADSFLELPWNLTAVLGGVEERTAGVVRLGPTSALKAWNTQSKTLSFDQPTAVDVRTRVSGGAITSITDGAVELTAPEGAVFTGTDALTATTSGGATVPNATLDGVRLEDDGRTLIGTMRGGSVSLANGAELRWTPRLSVTSQPAEDAGAGLRYTVRATTSNGSAVVDAVQPVQYPQAPVEATLSQVRVPKVKPGESSTVWLSATATRSVRDVTVVFHALTGTTFANSDVVTRALLGTGSYSGELNAPRTELRATLPINFAAPELLIGVSVAVDPSATDTATDGWASVSGPVTAKRSTLAVQVEQEEEQVPDPDPEHGNLSVTGGSTPSIKQGATGVSRFTLRHASGPAVPVRLSGKLPTGAAEVEGLVRVSSGGGNWTGVPVRFDPSTRTWSSQHVVHELRPNTTLLVDVTVRNAESGWSSGLREGGVLEVADDSAADRRWSTAFGFISALPADKVLVQCRSGANTIAEAQVRWAKPSGRYTATVERYRVFRDGAKADVGLMVRQGGGYEGAWATAKGKSVSRDWVELGLTARGYNQNLGRVDALLDMVVRGSSGSPLHTCQQWFVMPN
ncbi:hypothetical protein Q7F20_02305 [Curtobacterium sp. A7_M15]|nr:hypothetical protein [Curtobacterium sp. A7_M15]